MVTEDEIIEFIISEYPSWKLNYIYIKEIDKIVINDTIYEKIYDYELFYSVDIEYDIIGEIFNSVEKKFNINFLKPSTKDYIIQYISVCIPSFAKKYDYIKKYLF